MKTKVTVILIGLAFSAVLVTRLFFHSSELDESHNGRTPLVMEPSRGATMLDKSAPRLSAHSTKGEESAARFSQDPGTASTNMAAGVATTPDPNDRRARGLALMKRKWDEVQAREADYKSRAAALWEGMPLAQVFECMGPPRAADTPTQKPAWKTEKGEFPQAEFNGRKFELIYSTHETNFQRQVVTEPGFRVVRLFISEQGSMTRYDWEEPGAAGMD